MFGVKIQGGLGNQMFQYAFALAQEKRLKQSRFLDSYKYFVWNRRFVLDLYFEINYKIALANLLRKIFFYSRYFFKPPVLIQNQWDEPREFLQDKCKADILYNGFFQSEEFFKEY